MNEDETAPANDGFTNLGLDERLLLTLTELGYEEPSPIQREAIPLLLTGKDLIGQAATGTGKTAAFALPMLQRIIAMGDSRARPAALVLVPTRELAMQVAEAIYKYGQRIGTSVAAVYGGHSFSQQQRMLQRGVDVVVATPGRALDHIRRKTLNLSGIAIMALDEADEMLDMGFADDLEAILSETPSERQTVLFSATLPARIASMVKRHLREPLRVQIAKENVLQGDAPKVRQTAYIIPRAQKMIVLGRILDLENPSSALVFCRTRFEVDDLTERLSAYGYRAMALHGGLEQVQRTRVIKRLREGEIELVIATDVAARGLDIENLELVVNYDVPTSGDSYTHRIGRVGRAGREGVAITLADPRESRLLQHFERQTKSRIEVAQVPTVADLRAKRLELLRAMLREAIVAGGLDTYRVCVESLAQEHDLMDVALAAVKLAHQAAGGDPQGDDDDVRDYSRPAPGRDERPRGRDARNDRPDLRQEREARPAPDERPRAAVEKPPKVNKVEKPKREAPPAKPIPKPPAPVIKERAAPPVEAPPKPPAPAVPHPADDLPLDDLPPVRPTNPAIPGVSARVYVGLGRLAGLRPQDLVGAFATESGIKGNQIGAIEIADKYSIVEMPEALVEQVVETMGKTTIRGHKVVVRRFVEKKG